MATTYLAAVNMILKELNEVELSSGNFSSAVGIHAYTKDMINKAYFEIVNKEEEWPFLIEGDPEEPEMGSLYIETVVGQKWYKLKTASADIRSDFRSVDWDTFYLTEYGVTGASTPYITGELHFISTEMYKKYYRDRDNQSLYAGATTYDTPVRIFRSADSRSFGVSPLPDKVYRIYFSAWVQPTALSAHSDECVVPDVWMNVLYDKARHYLWLFKKDMEQAREAKADFKEGLAKMRRNLIDSVPDDMLDDRVRY
jgi:hypothetical protein